MDEEIYVSFIGPVEAKQSPKYKQIVFISWNFS